MIKKFPEMDFTDLKEFLLKHKIIPKTWSDRNFNLLKSNHKFAYSMALWDKKLSKKKSSDHPNAFISENRADSIQMIPVLLYGYRKPFLLLFRSCIENTLKHIYYFDHPVEFWLMLNREKHFLKFEELISYCKENPKLQGLDSANFLKPYFFTTSRFIHAESLANKNIAKVLSEMKFEQDFYETWSKNTEKLSCHINLLLAVFHKDIFFNMHREEQRLILGCLDGRCKKILHDITRI